jgi:hypothetical protein
VRMDTTRTVPIWSRAAASGNRLVKSKTLILSAAVHEFHLLVETERQIVHAPLRSGADSKGFKDNVCDSLRRERVAAADGCILRRLQEAAGGDDDIDGSETPLIQRDVDR